MTTIEIVRALAGCSFAPASFDKRFVRDVNAWVTAGKALTPKQEALVQKFGHRYRRQLGGCKAAACEVCAP